MCLDEVIARLCPKKAESPDGQAVPRAIDEFPSMNALKRQQIERHDWAIEQFRALRQECIQSEVGQHSTMQWGIAVAIGSIAAGLAMSSLTESIARALAPLQLMLFGLVIPWSLCAVSLVWLGEVRRMMRTGKYIRWMETQVHAWDEEASEVTGRPSVRILDWEHALSGGRPDIFARARDFEGYLGNGMIFAGGQLTSLIIWTALEVKYGLPISGLSLAWTCLLAWCQVPILWTLMVVLVFLRVLPLSSDRDA